MHRDLAALSTGPASVFAVVLLVLVSLTTASAQDAASLKARHVALRTALEHNSFQRPLYLESSEAGGRLSGDIYARIAQPYRVVGPALKTVGNWCDLLILHLNVKGCRSAREASGDVLSLHIGRKSDQPLAEASRLDFRFRILKSTPDYLRLELDAATGPLGTRAYLMGLEVVQLDAGHSFLHLSYSYAYGLPARIALRSYLSTTGRDKRGFSTVGPNDQGQPRLVDGTRGVIERNTMRYYLAIEAYLGALALPAPQQQARRLSDWHAGTERYPLQLRELGREEYLAMKRREIARLHDRP